MSIIRQRTPEWFEARRQGITSTDMVAILGLSRWMSEGDVARDKMGAEPPDEGAAAARRMRLGLEMENIIKSEEELEHGIKLRHVSRLIVHPSLPWAMTSLDFERIGERTIVEAKTSSSRRWDDGLPEDVEVQVRWQMGVAGYPRAHVAALRYGSTLECFDVEHDERTFQRMIVVAEDFRRRLAAGGPFSENRASVRRAFPLDDGSSMTADAELEAAVRDLLTTRAAIDSLTERRNALEAAIQTRMGPATYLAGTGWSITWRRTKDSAHTKWEDMADELLADRPDREAIMAKYTTLRPGTRRFTIRSDKMEKRDD